MSVRLNHAVVKNNSKNSKQQKFISFSKKVCFLLLQTPCGCSNCPGSCVSFSDSWLQAAASAFLAYPSALMASELHTNEKEGSWRISLRLFWTQLRTDMLFYFIYH
jgi:hypothetical protein